LQGNVDSVALSFSFSNVPKVSSSREEIPIPMETHRHHSIRRKESFFNSITVMNINVNIEDSLVVLEELKDGKDDVVDVAETFGLLFLGVMKATSPVDT